MDQPGSVSRRAGETVLIVGVELDRGGGWDVADSLDELALLCRTAGGLVVDRFVCRMARPHAATYIGSGKAREIGDRVRELAAKTVIFDDDLSPAQGRNLEKLVGARVIDRTQLILDIFAQHARTREGRMQIELAQLEYLLPRLKRMWTHLERQKGGIGLRGPGEQQIEMDRRRILERINRYRDDLEEVRGRRAELRRGRRRHGWALISLVGYTNAGKSTLINSLTGAAVAAADQLFATLDPTTRQLRLPNNQPALVTDTVGFIRKLPHHLVESFKATLEEVVEADVLVHVIDASHPLVDQQIEAVNTVLHDLGVHDTPVVHVFNKIDMEEGQAQARRLAGRLSPGVAVSAKLGQGLEPLRDLLADTLRSRHQRVELRIPLSEGRLLAALKSGGSVYAARYDESFAHLTVAIPPSLTGRCAPYCVDGTLAPIKEDAD